MKIKILLIPFFLFSLLISCATIKIDENPQNRDFRIAAVGDSITYGLGIHPRYKNSYPAQLEKMSGSRWVVGNFGKSGATLLHEGDRPYIKTKQYREALEFEPDLVIIMLGTNDSKLKNREFLDDFISDYLDLISTFQSLDSHPQVCICYPVPAFGGLYHIDDGVISKEIIPAIKKVADISGVLLLDLNSSFRSRSSLFFDTIHPDKEGAGVIAREIFMFIQDLTGSNRVLQEERI